MVGISEISIPWPEWKIVREIGHGSFGTVYEIERHKYSTTEKAAMKVISIPKDENDYEMMLLASGYDEDAVEQSIRLQLKRVEREYTLMNKMRDSTNIVRCEAFASMTNERGRGYKVFIRMELLNSMNTVIKKRRKQKIPFTEAEVLKLGIDICRALTVCEKHGIIHRDIKPQNILISSSGAYNLGDFGTARVLDHSTHATFAGTLSFMAPEVFRNEKYGKTVDFYSLGLVMYWLMNGFRMPFIPVDRVPTSDERDIAERRRMSGEAVPAPCNAGSELSRVILKACAFRSEDRYRSAEEMMADLIMLQRGEKPDVSTASREEGPVYREYKGDGREEAQSDNEKTLPLFGFGDAGRLAEKKTEASFRAQREKKPEANFSRRNEKQQTDEVTDPEVLYKRGLQFCEGDGVEQNYSEAAKWFRKSAEHGHSNAQNYLGWLYHNGYGVEQNYDQAFEWYRMAANQENATAQFNLGYCYKNGQGTEQSYIRATEWFRRAADQGDGDADIEWRKIKREIEASDPIRQLNLGCKYYKGNGVEQSYAQAVELFFMAAEQGNKEAQYNLGQCYKNGRGVEQDYSKAAEWYRKAARQGDKDAESELQAIVHQTGTTDAIVQLNLGRKYYKGDGVEQSYSKAVELFRRAAKQGNKEAQYNLGQCYKNGRGVEQDYSKAAEWYRKAADQGDEDAQYILGQYYEIGRGVEQDYSKAAEWYQKAAAQGNTYAQNNLGRCYEKGQGVEQNYDRAAEWYRKAAEKGNKDAQYNLAVCYKNGWGVEQNYSKAAEWYRAADKSGHKGAFKKLLALEEAQRSSKKGLLDKLRG